MITPQVFSLIKALTDSMSFGLATLTPGTSGANGNWYFGFGVKDKAPMDLPWKEVSKVMNSVLFGEIFLPYFLANLKAASLASVPELAKNTLEALCIPPDCLVFSTKFLESLPVHKLWNKLEEWTKVVDWSAIMAATCGSA
ncbi:hypothetical protein WICPIJ_002906 [Wickerhamomyces pijperi]|uniref:Uncharacterized protein n=1 Tax=Wickerhamomyces pijperi TaxID=599730 RepID=A0A9P8Q8T6_WICPI|nr:hypothetical protein WICPIJ_002906 [Wickerhamomyces pijperi]